MTIGEVRNEDRLVNRELCLSAQLPLPHDGSDAAPIRLSISHSILPSLVNKTLRYLNSSTWGRISSPTRRVHSTVFRLRTMDSDLEVLILIPAALQSAANRSSESWRSWSDEANRTTSSAKSSDLILRSPNRTPSTPWLGLEILSIKIMNRIGDKGQPWQGVQPSLETSRTYYRQCGQPLSGGPIPRTPG